MIQFRPLIHHRPLSPLPPRVFVREMDAIFADLGCPLNGDDRTSFYRYSMARHDEYHQCHDEHPPMFT